MQPQLAALGALLLAAFSIVEVGSVCAQGTTDPVTTFSIVPPERYDRNYSDITSAGARPLGYAVGRVQYNSVSPNLCVRLCGTATGSSVEVKTEPALPTPLCFKEARDDSGRCEVGGDPSACQPYSAASDGCSYFEFYLDANGQANEADVNFWYRFVISNTSDDTWCSSRNPDERPSSLQAYTMPATQPSTAQTSQAATSDQRAAALNAALFAAYVILVYTMS